MHPATAAILRWFEFEHLRDPELRTVGEMYHDVAHALAEVLPAGPENPVALRKLLESKDAAVRATLAGLDADTQDRLATRPKEDQ